MVSSYIWRKTDCRKFPGTLSVSVALALSLLAPLHAAESEAPARPAQPPTPVAEPPATVAQPAATVAQPAATVAEPAPQAPMAPPAIAPVAPAAATPPPSALSSISTTPADTSDKAVDAASHATLTASLSDAPLADFLKIAGISGGVRFRYATLPDSIVNTAFSNAPLWAALQAVVAVEGFQYHVRGKDVFVSRHAGLPAAQGLLPGNTLRAAGDSSVIPVLPISLGTPTVTNSPKLDAAAVATGWSQWLGAAAPGADWSYSSGAWTAGGAPATASAWHCAPVVLAADTNPGIRVLLTRDNAAGAATGPVWLRWPMPLRRIPTRSRLTIETAAPADLYVNGARMLRHWQGRRVLDLAQVLRPGYNCLAVYWAVPPAGAPDTPGPATLLHYEWNAPVAKDNSDAK